MDEDKQSMNSTPAMSTGSFVAPSSESGLTHPFFSNHPSQTFNTDAGDIILAGAAPVKPKFNKKPLIIGGIIAAVLVVVGVVAMMLIKVPSPKINSQTLNDAFNSYMQLLQNGEESTETLNDKWYFAELVDADLYSVDFSGYVAELKDRYNTFSEVYDRVKLKMTEPERQILDERLANYEATLQVVSAYLTIQDITNNILQEYITGGKTSAEGYVATILPNVDLEQNIAGDMVDLLTQYLNLNIEIDDIYARQGCITNGILSATCIGDVTGSVTNQLGDIAAEMTWVARNMAQIFKYLNTNFVNMTKDLADTFRGMNA